MVSLIGAPNAGKSTVFNRLVGERVTLVHKYPGVTRECVARRMDLTGTSRLTLLDTPGLVAKPANELELSMNQQSEYGFSLAQLVLLIVDASRGNHPELDLFLELHKKYNKSFWLLCNKSDRKDFRTVSLAISASKRFEISAEHGAGFTPLLESLRGYFPFGQQAGEERADDCPRIAIVGRTNSGKSTMTNRLLGEDLALTHPEAGSTRDSVWRQVNLGEKNYWLLDTAGLVKGKSKAGELDKLTAIMTLKAMASAELLLVVIDGLDPAPLQENRIIGMAMNNYRAMIILINKVDLAKPRERKKLAGIGKFRGNYRVLPVSALTGLGCEKIPGAISEALASYERVMPSGGLNRLIAEKLRARPPDATPGRNSAKIKYVHQGGKKPPVLVLHGRNLERLGENYKRFLCRAISEKFNLTGSPIRLKTINAANPYD